MARSLDGLVDDLAAHALGKEGADLALAIRRGDIEKSRDSVELPQSKGAYKRVWRALLEAPSQTVFLAFQDQLLELPPEDIATIINASHIPLKTVSELIDEEGEETLLATAPHLS